MNRPAPFGRGRLRRLLGLDRTAPAPTATRPGQPLHPLTIPNLVGYARLAAIPVFLYLALDSGDGRTASAAILFAAIAGGDYVDGFLARATGQYSRMGALLDPIVDRLTILSGAVVCWHFELLPRWALAVLVARELVTLVLAQAGAAAWAGAGDQLARPAGRISGHGVDLLRDGDRQLGADRAASCSAWSPRFSPRGFICGWACARCAAPGRISRPFFINLQPSLET